MFFYCFTWKINNFSFTKSLSNVTPQRHWEDLSPQDFLMTPAEETDMRKAYTVMIAKVISTFIPSLNFMAEIMPQFIRGDHF